MQEGNARGTKVGVLGGACYRLGPKPEPGEKSSKLQLQTVKAEMRGENDDGWTAPGSRSGLGASPPGSLASLGCRLLGGARRQRSDAFHGHVSELLKGP